MGGRICKWAVVKGRLTKYRYLVKYGYLIELNLSESKPWNETVQSLEVK